MRSPATRPQAPLSAAAWARWPDARSTRATAAADRKPVLHPVRRDIRFRPTFLCPVRPPLWSAIFVEEFGQPFHHGAATLLGVHDRHRIAKIAGDVLTDADRDQFHRLAVTYPMNHLPKMLYKKIGRASSRERWEKSL